jgi:hypothetical protein
MTSILTDIINDNMCLHLNMVGFQKTIILKKTHYIAKLTFIIDAIPFEKPMDIHTYHQY